MKKFLMIFFLLFGVVVISFSVWWNMESSVQGGVYLENHAGSVFLEVDTDTSMPVFELPVRWVKSHPWEDPPVIEDITMLNKDGTTITSLRGEYKIEVDSRYYQWHNRKVATDIELYINGGSIADKSGVATMPLSDTLQEIYIPEHLSITIKGEVFSFPMKDTYQIIPIKKEAINSMQGWGLEGSMHVLDETNKPKGFIVKLTGRSGAILKDILFWLPGMAEDYSQTEILYSLSGDMDQYLNNRNEFEGKPITYPLKMESNEILIYFPFTPDMKNVVNESVIHLFPHFKYSNSETGRDYYTGGSGMSGSRNKDRKVEDELIKPN